jgi:hypothetical protein
VNKTLPLSVINAIQSGLYVLCQVQGVKLTSTLPPQPDGSANSQVWATVFVDEDDQIHQIFLGDMLWHMWAVEGSLPDALGEHEVELPIPQGAFILHDGCMMAA